MSKKQDYIFKPLKTIKNLFVIGLFIYITVFVVAFISRNTFGQGNNIILGIIAIWLFLAYFSIPRIHRWLTKVYLPNYYIARTRTGDGLLGDPINLAFNGNEKQVKALMKDAGWIEAEKLSLESTVKMIKSTITRKSYLSAPVSSLFLFNEKQDLAFQQEVGGTTSKRHHIRFWKCPKGWFLPGGFKADWLAAATFDRKVGFSTFTLQITHKIEPDVDKERDFVLKSIKNTKRKIDIKQIENFTSSYHGRNGGGDLIETDGALPFITILPLH